MMLRCASTIYIIRSVQIATTAIVAMMLLAMIVQYHVRHAIPRGSIYTTIMELAPKRPS